MSATVEGIKYIYDRFKTAQDFYNTARAYREGLTEIYSSPYKEEVVLYEGTTRYPAHPHKMVFLRLEHKFTIQDQKRIAQEIDNLTTVINVLETLLYPSGSKTRYGHKENEGNTKQSLLNYNK